MRMSSKLVAMIPDDIKEELEKMSQETSLSMTVLVNLATQSLVANYREKGSFIFADLLNPQHRVRGGSNK